jgi:hypothetical protein
VPAPAVTASLTHLPSLTSYETLKTPSYTRILTVACCSALGALALMVWSLLYPTPMPVLVAMSAGQILGTMSLFAFLGVVVADFRRAHLERELRSGLPRQPTLSKDHARNSER